MTIVEEPVISALNARSLQSGRINEGMTSKQCHVANCNSQQVEGNARWDRHSSGDLRNWQMDDQDEGSRIIYITREISRKGGRQFGRREEVLLVKRRRRIHPRTRLEDGLWPSPQLRRWRSCSPRILPDRWWSPHKGPVLKPASLPNSLYWACWVWVRSHLQWDPPENGTLQLAPSVGRTWVPVRTIIEQGRAKPPRGNDDGQPIGLQTENCREVPSPAGV